MTSKFSFTNGVFDVFEELSVIYIKCKIVVWKLFEFERVYSLLFGKGLKSFVIGPYSTAVSLIFKLHNFAELVHILEKSICNEFWQRYHGSIPD